ncbi:DNA fragmentation factor subunit alpha-like isoform X2 [Pleurodeles waltl]
MMANAAGDADRLHLKMCRVSARGVGGRHGVAAANLRELQRKVLELLPLSQPITLVLEEDGTIVDDEDYFLCLPSNTEFVALSGNQTWTPMSPGGGEFVSYPAHVSSASVDELDSPNMPRWKQLAAQLKCDLSQIILLSEEDLQLLTDVPCQDLALEMGDSPSKVRGLQDTLQRLLDRREDERRSKQLLQLYLEALKGEGSGKPMEMGSSTGQATDEVDISFSVGRSHNIHLSCQILSLIKEKSSPEISLSNLQLETVCKKDTDTLALELGWDKPKVRTLQEACQEELSRRLKQVHTLCSLSSLSKGRKPQPEGHRPRAKRRK